MPPYRYIDRNVWPETGPSPWMFVQCTPVVGAFVSQIHMRPHIWLPASGKRKLPLRIPIARLPLPAVTATFKAFAPECACAVSIATVLSDCQVLVVHGDF